MRVFTQALAAGVPMPIAMRGNFFMLIGTSSPLSVSLRRGGQSLDEDAVGVEAGYKATPLDGFDAFTLTSALAQTVTLGVARGTGGYDRGAAAITNTVTVQGPRVITAGPLVTDQPLLMRDVGSVPGAQFLSNANQAALATQQVFSAASNVNGAIVWDVEITTASAAQQSVALLAKATAPTTAIDGTEVAQVGCLAAALGTLPRMPHPRFIPAGLGLFFFIVALETQSYHKVDYTLL